MAKYPEITTINRLESKISYLPFAILKFRTCKLALGGREGCHVAKSYFLLFHFTTSALYQIIMNILLFSSMTSCFSTSIYL